MHQRFGILAFDEKAVTKPVLRACKSRVKSLALAKLLPGFLESPAPYQEIAISPTRPRFARIQVDGELELLVGPGKLEIVVRNPRLSGVGFRGIGVQVLQLFCDHTLLTLGICRIGLDVDGEEFFPA